MDQGKLEHQYKELQVLYRIATQLNSAVDLAAALNVSLKETVDLLGLQTAWIWLLDLKSNSVSLAASHNLPPAFTTHPEKLSGWCYCIDQYLSNERESVGNISEITCSRLEDLKEGTNGLRFHATVPLYDQDKKMGILNVVSASSGQLTKNQLDQLHTIGNLLSVAITRTRLFEQSRETGVMEERKRLTNKLKHSLEQVATPIQELLQTLEQKDDSSASVSELRDLHHTIQQLYDQYPAISNQLPAAKESSLPFQYPVATLTKRELEVLNLLKEGKTNKTIGSELFISERTVKFHVSILLSKLHAKNRTDAVQIAVKRGIIVF